MISVSESLVSASYVRWSDNVCQWCWCSHECHAGLISIINGLLNLMGRQLATGSLTVGFRMVVQMAKDKGKMA